MFGSVFTFNSVVLVVDTKPEPPKNFSWSNVVRRNNQPPAAAPASADAFSTPAPSAFSKPALPSTFKPAPAQQPTVPVPAAQSNPRERPPMDQRSGFKGRTFDDSKPAGGKFVDKRPTAPDAHQLFVGNLHSDVFDNDLKELFGRESILVLCHLVYPVCLLVLSSAAESV